MPLHIDLVFWPLFALQALEHATVVFAPHARAYGLSPSPHNPIHSLTNKLVSLNANS